MFYFGLYQHALDLTHYKLTNDRPYILNLFNIKESIATHEEIEYAKQFSLQRGIGKENDSGQFMPEILNYPDNVWLHGYWQHEEYFADISNILLREFTLKKSLSRIANNWKEKILATECSVSLHFRHGDFIYSPVNQNMSNFFAIPPLDYYYKCINNLKREYKNLTLFVFSDNLNWAKENLRVNVPIEFVEGEGLQDFEELYLMSLCRHNIISKSTFSWWGAWLNQNPDKKVFMPIAYSNGIKIGNQYSETTNKNSPFDSDRWIRVPFDINAQPSVTMRPWFSILLVVNNDAATFVESLNTILGQDYKFFELIIIDNASTDGSGKICQQVVKAHDNITLIKLHKKVQNGAAWNIALKAAQGYYVLFFKGNDRILANALTSLYLTNEHILADIVNGVAHLKETEQGDIDINDKKFVLKKMTSFQNFEGVFRGKLDKTTLLKILSNDDVISPLQTRIFKREFLMENKIEFNEKIGDDAESLFTVAAMFQTAEIIFMSKVFYVAPK